MLPQKPSDLILDVATLLARGRVAVFALSNEGVITYISYPSLEIMGYLPKEMVGKKFTEFIVAEDHALAWEFLKSIQSGESTGRDFQCRLRKKDGNLIWLSTSIHLGEGSSPSYTFIGITNEISAYKDTETILQQTRAALDRAAIVSTTDTEGLITSVNDTFCKVSKYHASEIVGKNHRVLKSGVHPDSLYKEIWENVKKGGLWQGEICNRAKDGSFYWVYSTIFPIFSSSQIITGFMSIRFDITALKTAQEQLLQTSKLATVGVLTAGVSHEINNPLTVIIGKIRAIEKNLASPEKDLAKVEEDLERINSMAARIGKIVKGLRTFSRDGVHERSEPTDVAAVIEDSLLLCSERFNRHGVELRTNLTEESIVACRPVQISQAVVNLLNNAFDAVQAENEKWVSLEMHKDASGKLLITVSDSGKGIPAEIADKLMIPFFTTKEPDKGTGLGLSIAKGIVEDHGGRLYYDPKKLNTTFVIELPLVQTA